MELWLSLRWKQLMIGSLPGIGNQNFTNWKYKSNCSGTKFVKLAVYHFDISKKSWVLFVKSEMINQDSCCHQKKEVISDSNFRHKPEKSCRNRK